MRLNRRLEALEAAIAPQPARWVRIFQDEGQSQDQAIAAHEAEHGPIDDANIILRVIINKPFPMASIPIETPPSCRSRRVDGLSPGPIRSIARRY